MKIGGFDTARHPLLIAEIGNNHEGSFALARQLVERAAECGVGAVKFQTFRTDQYVSRKDTARYRRLKSFELTLEQFRQLADIAHAAGLLFISTPFDMESARGLESIVDAYKIASGDNDFYPLIREVALTEKPLLISTGLCDSDQVSNVAKFVRTVWAEAGGRSDLALLHCVSAYPVPPEEANLLAIPMLRELAACEIGYSDHTIGPMASLAAVAVGATIVEKHFTLDKHYSDFRDHQLSADPEEMAFIAKHILQVAALRGTATKAVQPSEAESIKLVRRSIVAARRMNRGEIIGWGDLTWIRPRDGLPPGNEHLLEGKRLVRAIDCGEPILPEDVE